MQEDIVHTHKSLETECMACHAGWSEGSGSKEKMWARALLWFPHEGIVRQVKRILDCLL